MAQFPKWPSLSWLHFVFLQKEENLGNLPTVSWRLLCSPWQNRQDLSLTWLKTPELWEHMKIDTISKTSLHSHTRGQASWLPLTQDQAMQKQLTVSSSKIFPKPQIFPLQRHEDFSEGWTSSPPLSKILHWKLPPKQGAANELWEDGDFWSGVLYLCQGQAVPRAANLSGHWRQASCPWQQPVTDA